MSVPSTPPVEPPSPPASPPRPERLGAYELLAELAAGGMATVHLAYATDSRQGPPLVAIKRPHRHLASDKRFVTMLVDEARLASAIDDPRVVKVRELGFEGGLPFIVMDYVEGASLAELRRELAALGRAIDVRVSVRIALDTLGGLHAAHELRDDNARPLHIIHRDVSPHNVLIGCDGRAFITDFGIATAEGRVQTTRTHEVKGKLAYLAPERVDKRRMCTVQSDVFSAAVVLWECLAGRRLFRSDEAVDVLQEVTSAPIPTLAQIGAQIPPMLDDVIARGLSRDLETRYATALLFAQALERAMGPENIGSHSDVARLMEAVFGARMALRQEQVRATIGRGNLADLLRESGLPARERPPVSPMPSAPVPAELAPPAPIGTYSPGTASLAAVGAARFRRLPWRSIADVTGGVALGVLVTLRFSGRHAEIESAPAHDSASSGVAPGAMVNGLASPRKFVLPLPFVTRRVTIDTDVPRVLDPPTDAISLEVPADRGLIHRVTAVALDGTRAEGNVREEDGIGRPDAEGYTFTAPSQASDDVHRVGAGPAAHLVGTVRNGFTKLK